MYRMKMDCITTAVSRGTDTLGRPGRVTALDFLYQVKTPRDCGYHFCYSFVSVLREVNQTAEFMSQIKNSLFPPQYFSNQRFLKKKKILILYTTRIDIPREVISGYVKFHIPMTQYGFRFEETASLPCIFVSCPPAP